MAHDVEQSIANLCALATIRCSKRIGRLSRLWRARPDNARFWVSCRIRRLRRIRHLSYAVASSSAKRVSASATMASTRSTSLHSQNYWRCEQVLSPHGLHWLTLFGRFFTHHHLPVKQLDRQIYQQSAQWGIGNQLMLASSRINAPSPQVSAAFSHDA